MSMQSHSLRQRRRRVTLDQQQAASSPVVESARGSTVDDTAGSAGNAPSYSEGARRRHQLKTTDLIPRHWAAVSVLAILLLAVVALLNLPGTWADQLETVAGAEGLQVLVLEADRGIGSWYCNFLLLLTCCVSLQLFLLRQHRRDDYRGSYRIWLWFAGFCLLASMATVTDIPVLLGNLWTRLTGSAGGVGWLIAAKLVGLMLLVFRGIVEVRHSRLALCGLVLVFFAYGLAALIHDVPEYQSLAGRYVQSAEQNLLLVGSSLLLLTVIGYARYVYLEANNLIERKPVAAAAGPADETGRRWRNPLTRLFAGKSVGKTVAADSEPARPAREEKRKKRVEADGETRARKRKPAVPSESTTRQTGPPERKRKKAKRRPAAETADQPGQPQRSAARQQPMADELDEDLSKSERRRLRKLKRREQRRAA